MPDFNDINKPDINSSHAADVWPTVIANNLSALKMDGAVGKAGLVAGIKRWVHNAATGAIQLWQRDSANVDVKVFDSSDLLNKTQAAQQTVNSPVNFTGAITGIIDSNTTYFGQALNVQGISCNTVTKPGAYVYSHGNAANTNAPPDSPLYGAMSVTSDKDAGFTTQTISPDAPASAKGWWTRTWYGTNAPAAIWRRFAMHAEDVVFKSIRVTEQPRATFRLTGTGVGNQTVLDTIVSGGMIASSSAITIPVAGDYTFSSPFMRFFFNTSGADARNVFIVVNGNVQARIQCAVFGGPNIYYYSACTLVLRNLAANDVINFNDNSLSNGSGIDMYSCILFKNIT